MGSSPIAATATSPPLVFPTALTSINISNWFAAKMDRASYLCWRVQFLDVLTIHDLSFVLQPDFLPPPASSADHRCTPDFATRTRFDRLVMCWIRVTVAPAIQQILLPCNSAHEAWSLLEQRLTPRAPALRRALRHLEKTPEKSMFDFLLEATGISNSLAAVGSPVAEHDLVDFILDALSDDYTGFVAAIDLRPPPSFHDLYDRLLHHEALISGRCPLTNFGDPGDRDDSRTVANISSANFMQPLPPIMAPVPPPEACQICYRLGHLAPVCPRRDDIDGYANRLPGSFQTMSIADAPNDLGSIRSESSSDLP